jgi:hypothetical protein
MNNIPKAGDTVYNMSGEMAIFVNPAKGGGYIVQPLIEGGDDISEPAGHYVDGVSIWLSVYKEPPQPMLDTKIAEQEARLAMLRGEVRAVEKQKRDLEADQRAMKDRLALHDQLTWIDDLIAGRFTHYLVKTGDYSEFWDVRTAEDFRKDRNHSQIRMQLWVSTHERGETFAWKVTACSPGDRFDDKSYGVIPFKSEAEAVSKRDEFLADLLAKRIADHPNTSSHNLRSVVQRCQTVGMTVPAAVLEDLRARELREAQAEYDKQQTALDVAQQRLKALAA